MYSVSRNHTMLSDTFGLDWFP